MNSLRKVPLLNTPLSKLSCKNSAIFAIASSFLKIKNKKGEKMPTESEIVPTNVPNEDSETLKILKELVSKYSKDFQALSQEIQQIKNSIPSNDINVGVKEVNYG